MRKILIIAFALIVVALNTRAGDTLDKKYIAALKFIDTSGVLHKIINNAFPSGCNFVSAYCVSDMIMYFDLRPVFDNDLPAEQRFLFPGINRGTIADMNERCRRLPFHEPRRNYLQLDLNNKCSGDFLIVFSQPGRNYLAAEIFFKPNIPEDVRLWRYQGNLLQLCFIFDDSNKIVNAGYAELIAN